MLGAASVAVRAIDDKGVGAFAELDDERAANVALIDTQASGREQQAADITFQAHPMSHVNESGGPGAFGYSVRIGDKTVAYTGDTMFCEEAVKLGEGADAYVVDCTYSEGCGPEHMGLEDVKKIRKRLPPETAIILTHRNGLPNVNGLENTLIAEDLKTFRF